MKRLFRHIAWVGALGTASLTASSQPASADSGTTSSEGAPLAGPVPFLESHPLLAEIRQVLSKRVSSKKELQAAKAVLEDWLKSKKPKEPLALVTGEWLRARLLSKLDPKAKSTREAWEMLATGAMAFSNEAREELAALDKKANRPDGAAHWSLTRSPWAPGFFKGVQGAVADLGKRSLEGLAIEHLEAALLQGMSSSTRVELVLLLAELHHKAKQPARGEDLLLQSFWHDSDVDKRVLKALEAYKKTPSVDEQLFHDALHAGRKQALEALKKAQARRTPLATVAALLAERWGDNAKQALERLPELTPDSAKQKGLVPVAYTALARGMLLRKLDRDAEAIESFLFAVKHAPNHPLTQLARDQASYLLRMHNRAKEADPLDVEILAQAIPGPLHRSALWRLGFGAALERKDEVAELHLRELERRHGGEPDRHAFCWYERARYWRGRAAEMGRRSTLAKEHWQMLIQRFPAGWYALLARSRMGGDKAGKARVADAFDAQGWEVQPEDPMATAIALYRLGEERLALEHFEALHLNGQLPGNGRKLYAELLEVIGQSSKASRVLKHAQIPPTMPGDDPDLVYLEWFPLRFEDALGAAASRSKLPSSLLAGVVSVETRFNANSRSSVGAMGAAQLMRSTGTAIGKRVYGKDFEADSLMDPEVNLTIAAEYLSTLLERFAQHPALAVAAYNAGPVPVRRWLEARGELELDAFVELIPFEQARRYVMRVLSDAEIYRRLYSLDGKPLNLPLSLKAAKR